MDYDLASIRDRISVERLTLDTSVTDFSCGKESLDEFVNTEEAREFHRRRLGRTRLVFWEGDLAAYYTLAPNALTDGEYDGTETEHAQQLHEKYVEIPAQLLGRLAVDEEYTGRGLGQFLVERTIAETIRCESPFRVVLLHAQPDVIEFYEQYGFVLSDVPRNEDKHNKIMFYDLGPVGAR